jgi:hypothetical protein
MKDEAKPRAHRRGSGQAAGAISARPTRAAGIRPVSSDRLGTNVERRRRAGTALPAAPRNRQDGLLPIEFDEHGQYYMLDFEMTVGVRIATIRPLDCSDW